MPLKVLLNKPEPDDHRLEEWHVHAIKVVVALLMIFILVALLGTAFRFATYYKTVRENEKLIEVVEGSNSRINLALLEREANIARARSLETLIIKGVKGDEAKIKIATINRVISEFITERGKDASSIPVTSLRDEVCKKLAGEGVPCSP